VRFVVAAALGGRYSRTCNGPPSGGPFFVPAGHAPPDGSGYQEVRHDQHCHPTADREPAALLSRAPLLLGLDGTKMGKSRGNAIPLAASEDETARLVHAARTDGQRRMTYDPASRPEVSNLLLLTALCLDSGPQEVAESLGDRGAAALKGPLTDALNERLRPIRARRRELAADPGYLRHVLAGGCERARQIAAETLAEVNALMHTRY